MCGLMGVMGQDQAVYLTYLGLRRLQHRGQESSGIVGSDGKKLIQKRGMGHVKDVFDARDINNWPGFAAIGHNRYSTAGDTSVNEAQPFLGEPKYGHIALCHNGNLPYAMAQREQLKAQGAFFASNSDTEVVLNLISRSDKDNVVEAFIDALTKVEGAYSMLLLTKELLVAVRDPCGFRPLCLGRLGEAWVVASETVAFQLIDAKYEREVEPGEVLVLEKGCEPRSFFPFSRTKRAECIFEDVYFSRPDSHVFGNSVSRERLRMGARLAIEHPIEADAVVPIPDSGIMAAVGYAEQSGIHYRPAFTRDHYMGRTFIDPNYLIRGLNVRYKLGPVPDLIEGQRLILIDDSIVRSNTIREIVILARKAKAAEVHVCVSCPPVKWPCYQGIATPTREELIAAMKPTIETIRQEIDADSLHYLSLEGLLWACGDESNTRHCVACYTGEYPIRVEGGISMYERQKAAGL